jgi:hypothetical protein
MARQTYKRPPQRTPAKPRLLSNRVSAVVLEILCGDETHFVRIERDSSKKGYSVTMLDHPDFNEEMVSAFVSFGAKPPPCWVVAEQWSRDPWWAAKGLTPAASKAPYVACKACGWESSNWGKANILEWSDLEHIAEGQPHPAGVCPECGSYVYPAFKLIDPIIKQLEGK